MNYILWCKNKNEWEKDSWVILPNGNIAWTKYGNIVGCANPKNHTLVRSIGLKDKNGKEIYEGDIVEFILSKKKHIGEIHYKELEGFYLKFTYIYDNHEYDFSIINLNDPHRNVKVIGNVYENPELLERE